jgi:hypothetical protein
MFERESHMAKKQKRWIYSPRKPVPPRIPEEMQEEVTKKANELIERHHPALCVKKSKKQTSKGRRLTPPLNRILQNRKMQHRFPKVIREKAR